eukprot:TRINITY_DN10559_c0_g1_i1.p3 TRINITY_DN10559_c0_g1~~TRINITY_DN10559_c0_g1_i1.p3  ORF type:complete len:118 (-),score=16.44 TRINITY_DN10559_c0_g1_i1:300-653(-)
MRFTFKNISFSKQSDFEVLSEPHTDFELHLKKSSGNNLMRILGVQFYDCEYVGLIQIGVKQIQNVDQVIAPVKIMKVSYELAVKTTSYKVLQQGQDESCPLVSEEVAQNYYLQHDEL